MPAYANSTLGPQHRALLPPSGAQGPSGYFRAPSPALTSHSGVMGHPFGMPAYPSSAAGAQPYRAASPAMGALPTESYPRQASVPALANHVHGAPGGLGIGPGLPQRMPSPAPVQQPVQAQPAGLHAPTTGAVNHPHSLPPWIAAGSAQRVPSPAITAPQPVHAQPDGLYAPRTNASNHPHSLPPWIAAGSAQRMPSPAIAAQPQPSQLQQPLAFGSQPQGMPAFSGVGSGCHLRAPSPAFGAQSHGGPAQTSVPGFSVFSMPAPQAGPPWNPAGSAHRQ